MAAATFTIKEKEEEEKARKGKAKLASLQSVYGACARRRRVVASSTHSRAEPGSIRK